MAEILIKSGDRIPVKIFKGDILIHKSSDFEVIDSFDSSKEFYQWGRENHPHQTAKVDFFLEFLRQHQKVKEIKREQQK